MVEICGYLYGLLLYTGLYVMIYIYYILVMIANQKITNHLMAYIMIYLRSIVIYWCETQPNIAQFARHAMH